MKVGVIGGGINGVMTAWELARRGCQVDLFEKGTLMSATSRASTKMLHGGLRYLEFGHFGLVREALQERGWWIKQVPELTRKVEIMLPVLQRAGRTRWQLGIGVRLYDFLASGSGFPKGHWNSADLVSRRFPTLKRDRLLGAYSYWDGQMDDYRLGLWAAAQATASGVRIRECTPVSSIDLHGNLVFASTASRYDRVVNVAGPWAGQLLHDSAISTRYSLDLVRGSHLLLKGDIECGCVLQVPGELRILFVLPYKGNTLLGTTEVRQQLADDPVPDDDEINYLLNTYNHFFSESRSFADVIDLFSGIRPIVASGENVSTASREFVLERQGYIVNVFGGKWTTSRRLAMAAADLTLT